MGTTGLSLFGDFFGLHSVLFLLETNIFRDNEYEKAQSVSPSLATARLSLAGESGVSAFEVAALNDWPHLK